MVLVNDYSSFLNNNIRKCRDAWNFLTGYSVPRPSGLNDYKDKIHYLVKQRVDVSNLESVKQGINQHYEQYIIPENDIEWINKYDPRACYFVYKQLEHLYINFVFGRYHINLQHAQEDQFSLARVFIRNGNEYHDNLKGKLNFIFELIDNLNLNKEIKTNIINHIRSIYNQSRAIDDFTWFNDNEVNPKWLYDYMFKNLFNHKVYYTLDQNIPSDYFFSALEIFDMWDSSSESKELFLIKLKKAYQQKLYRERKSGKERTYTYSMNPGIKEKMDDLSRWTGKPKNIIVQELILKAHREQEKEYENMF